MPIQEMAEVISAIDRITKMIAALQVQYQTTLSILKAQLNQKEPEPKTNGK